MDESGRERVVGAVVLMLAAFFLVPLLFGDPKDPTATITSSFEGEAVEVPLRPRAEPTVMREVGEKPVESVEVVSAAKAAPSSTTSAPEEKAAPPATQPSEKATDRWVLQLASFEKMENAERLRRALRADGHRAYVETRTVKGRRLHRVRVGPVAGKSRAETLRKKLERDFRVDIRIYPA